MRVLRIAPARQMALFTGQDDSPDRWDDLPGHVKAQVLALLASMIMKSLPGEGGPADREVRP